MKMLKFGLLAGLVLGATVLPLRNQYALSQAHDYGRGLMVVIESLYKVKLNDGSSGNLGKCPDPNNCPAVVPGSLILSPISIPPKPWFFIVSNRNPQLALNAYGGARHNAPVKLHNGCDFNNLDCLWALNSDGMIVSVRNPFLGLNALNGAKHLGDLALREDCDSFNPDCTWSVSNGMILSNRNHQLAINGYGGAKHLGAFKLHNGCAADNPDCTFTFIRID